MTAVSIDLLVRVVTVNKYDLSIRYLWMFSFVAVLQRFSTIASTKKFNNKKDDPQMFLHHDHVGVARGV